MDSGGTARWSQTPIGGLLGIATSSYVDVVLLTSFSIHASFFERVASQLSQLHGLLQTWLVSLYEP